MPIVAYPAPLIRVRLACPNPLVAERRHPGGTATDRALGMKRFFLACGLAAAFMALAPAAPNGAAWAQDDVVAQRKAGMKAMGADLDAIKAVVEGNGSIATLGPRAEEMRAFYARLPALFPEGSTADSKARPEVWTDRAGFERANALAGDAANKLVAAVAANDSAALAVAFREIAGSCGTCHRSYRAR
jgi:cytochrome c556